MFVVDNERNNNKKQKRRRVTSLTISRSTFSASFCLLLLVLACAAFPTIASTTTGNPTGVDSANVDEERETIFVIGAGISGLAAANTLLEESLAYNKLPPPRVIVLEANPDRVGGRLHSQTLQSHSRKDDANTNATTTTTTSSSSFGIDLGGASLHGGSESALGRYFQKQNFATIDWGSSIYPGESHAEWWNFHENNNNNNNNYNATIFETLSATEMLRTEPYILSWRGLMGDCLKKTTFQVAQKANATTTTTTMPSTNNNNNNNNNNTQSLLVVDDANRIMRYCLDLSLREIRQNITAMSNDHSSSSSSRDNGGITWSMFLFSLYMENEMDRGISLTELSVDGYDNDWDYIELPNKGPDIAMAGANGMQLLVDTLAAGLDIRLGERVVRIDYDEHSCNITTESLQGGRRGGGQEVYPTASRACIVTLPVGVLKKSHASMFHPPLPTPKRDALHRAGISAFNTLVIEWKVPVCRIPAVYMIDSPLSETNPLSRGFLCPEILRSNYSISSSPSHVTQFYISGTTFSTTNKENGDNVVIPLDFSNATFWKQQALEVVSLYYDAATSNNNNTDGATTSQTNSELVLEDIASFHLTNWHSDPDILGSYSAPVSGTQGNDDRQRLKDSVGTTLYFAGEHTNVDGRYQTIDGAYDSGILAARQLLKDAATAAAGGCVKPKASVFGAVTAGSWRKKIFPMGWATGAGPCDADTRGVVDGSFY